MAVCVCVGGGGLKTPNYGLNNHKVAYARKRAQRDPRGVKPDSPVGKHVVAHGLSDVSGQDSSHF